MDFTMEGGKKIIWTTKEAISYDYPANEVTENFTRFFKNLSGCGAFAQCPARWTDEEKEAVVTKQLGFAKGTFILKSKHSHKSKSINHERT